MWIRRQMKRKLAAVSVESRMLHSASSSPSEEYGLDLESEEKKGMEKTEITQTETVASSNPFRNMELNVEKGVRNFDESILIKRKAGERIMNSLQSNAVCD